MKPLPEDWDRAVAVVAHPDDLEYGVASAIARWTGQGKTVSYLLATRGEAGIEGMHPDRAGPLRVAEERRSAAVVGVGDPAYYADVTATIDAGVASLREHRAYLDGLGREFDPDEFLKNMAGFVGLAAECEYAVGFRRYPMG